MKCLYDYGLPFSKQLALNYDDEDDRVKKKKASLIIIDGGIGEGKTTLLTESIDYFNKINGFGEYDLKNGIQLAMGGSDFLKKLDLCYQNKLPVIAYDEAGDFNRRGSLTQFNAMLNRTFETFRAFKIIVLVGLPNFSVLDQQLFDNQIPRLLLHLENRTENQGNFKAFSLYGMLQLKAMMKKLTVKPFAYKIIDENFRGHFLDLQPERSKVLDQISIKNKIDILRKSEAKIEGLMNIPELSHKLFKGIPTIRNMLSALKIKPYRKISRINYYTMEDLARLSEYSEERSGNLGRPRKII